MASVIWAAIVGLAAVCSASQTLFAQGLVQHGKRPTDSGPRALGLVQLSIGGRPHFFPIVIMIDGKFYDAGSFKANPVPMALDFGTIYEAFHTGVSQGLFTITQPGQLNHNWIAEGSWLPAGAKPPETRKKYSAPVMDDDTRDDRPTLHRRKGGEADKDDSKPATTSGTGGSTTSTSTPSTGSAPPQPSSSSPSPTTSSQPSTTAPASASKDAPKSTPASTTSADSDQPFNDPNRPVLRRGKPDLNARHELVTFDDSTVVADLTPGKGGSKSAAAAPVPSVQTFAAISDAKGPDPRPYTYDLKPAEEAIYRNKMLDLAATLVKLGPAQSSAQKTSSAKTSTSAAAARTKSPSVSPRDEFSDIKLRIFDLSNSNEPVLVLSAQTSLPAATSGSPVPQEITLIARTNLEGELQKLFFAQTDSRHLDVSPRMELIDAVDADGDGRAELLFRRTFDIGSAYAIYRVTADQLWPLYEATP